MKRIVSTERYIGALKTCLTVRDDFKDLQYYRSAKGEEYCVMSDIIGQVLILDITGYSIKARSSQQYAGATLARTLA